MGTSYGHKSLCRTQVHYLEIITFLLKLFFTFTNNSNNMKTIIKSFTLILVALFIFSNNTNAQDKKIKKDSEVKFAVELECPSCVKKLEAKLPFEEGVSDLKVDLATKTIWFKYQSNKTDKEKLAKALEKLGYPGKEVEIKK